LTRAEQRYNPLDFEPDVAIGIGLPLVNGEGGKYPTPKSGSLENADQDIGATKFSGGVFHSTYTTTDQVKANIKNLVLTNPGERFYHPNFGIGIQGLLFENITPAIIKEVHEAIYNQIKLWLPYVTIKAVDIDTDHIDMNELKVKLDYTVFNNDMDLQTVVIFT
jgi:phage baseplate assembly protein W